MPTSVDFSQSEGSKPVLVGFSCGSLCIYDKEFTSPTVSIPQAVGPVLKVQWFPRSKASFMVLDAGLLVTLWDLKRSTTAPIVSFTLSLGGVQCADFALPGTSKVNPLLAIANAGEVTVLELSLKS